MLTAEEAKIRTENKISELSTQEIASIERYINMAIDKGESSIPIESLRNKTIETLIAHHYNVETISKRNEAYYRISWE